MSEELKLIIQWIAYPLLSIAGGLIILVYKKDLKLTKTELCLKFEGQEREMHRLDNEVKDRLDHTNTNIEKLFCILNEISMNLSEIKGKINTQDEICKLRHRDLKN